MTTLFADADPLNAAGIVGGIIGLMTAGWTILRQFNKDRAESKQAEKKQADETEKVKKVDTIAELKMMLDQLRADFDTYKRETKADLQQARKEMEDAEARSHECDRKSERMSAHIFYLEDAMRKGGIDFRPWVEVENGSAKHMPLKKE
jgi:Na+-transporting NADH:ubiquinone oxidoreductase subunit NqrC